MSTVRVPSPGTKMRAKTGGSWGDFIGIVSIGGTDVATGEIETTELDPYAAAATTPASASYELYKTFVAGWINAGEIGMEGNFTQLQWAALFALQNVGTSFLIAVHFRNGYAFVCECFIKGLGWQAPMGDELVKMPFTLKLSGKPSVVTHSAANAL